MLCLSTVLCVAALCAQDAPPPQKKGGGGGQPHKNLKVLKDENIGQIMNGYRVGLGVQCTHCHVQGNFASDENPKKDIARHMITMVTQINANFTDGKEHVNCYTCHRGAIMPLTAPPPAAAPGQ
jgi:hypothetical protein